MRLRSTIGESVAVAILLTACGGGGDGGDADPVGDGRTVRVEAFDRQDYNADGFSAVAGEITFRLSQVGIQEHTLVVEGMEDEMRLVVEDGGTDSGNLTLEPGRYILYCDIAGHRSSGMEARLTVG
ncbi:MAG: hypothetical protein QF796_05845 [Acidimicrobiales bacterium]|nr:hypothetical protein [Acidimicrobiales bacterium]MDP6649642.1 hypothetical protein [Acidimicrobiales bacterium]MDP6759842.1 hypothetical protein [Acidimicrobiales bacterium]